MQEVVHYGKYHLIDRLAAGGMAEVFLARFQGPGGFEKTAVLKRILPHLASDPEFITMFLDEARIAARLSHPNIVQVFDFGEAEGTYYLCMEYLCGENLAALMRLAAEKKVRVPARCATACTTPTPSSTTTGPRSPSSIATSPPRTSSSPTRAR